MDMTRNALKLFSNGTQTGTLRKWHVWVGVHVQEGGRMSSGALYAYAYYTFFLAHMNSFNPIQKCCICYKCTRFV